ncbi:MAG TPA: HNH endonuclease family protein, partial [Gemmatimonadaceae bacterium]|nr:HNH endonuclease family protein [Gemmatimonadaceae bacterium]
AKFDEPFWRKEVKQGRLERPRSDLFMQHFLASKQGRDIPIKHLYVEYKAWIEQARPFANIKAELAALSGEGDNFRRIIEPKQDDPIFDLVSFLDTFDIRTAYPLLMMFLDTGVSDSEWKAISQTLESYLLRRAICGLSTKNYNRVFLQLTKNLRGAVSNQNLAQHLTALTGDSAAWPSDADFSDRWRKIDAYNGLGSLKAKLVHVLKRLNATYLGPKMEDVVVAGNLTIEHLMPQSWIENWPLQSGAKGMGGNEIVDADESDTVAVASRSRNAAVQTFGNLTIVTGPLNSSISNGSWSGKKPELLKHSLLPINQLLHDSDSWDETTIASRGEALLSRALKLWPRT